MPAITPTMAHSPPVRERPRVTTARAGIPIAGSCVVGSITRSGRRTTQPEATTSTSRAIAARPAHPASSRSSQPDGLRPLAEGLVVHRRGEGDDVEQRADEGDQPHRAEEADGDDVLGALGPCGDDEHERTEQHRHPEDRQHAAEPRRSVGRLRRVRHLVVAGGAVGAGGRVVDVGAGAAPPPGLRRRRRLLHGEAEASVDAGLAGGLADLPAHLARPRRDRLEHLDGQRAGVVADGGLAEVR